LTKSRKPLIVPASDERMLAQSWALLYESGAMIEKESAMVSLERSRSIDNAGYREL
jgi:hypothetical protein